MMLYRCRVSIGSNTTEAHPQIARRMFDAIDGGAKLIVIDPRVTMFAQFADMHLPITPGTDVVLLNSLMYVILDEGLVVTENVIELVQQPVALIGISEKGLLNLELNLEQEGGHASMPGRTSAVGQMSKALHLLEDNPMPARLSYPVSSMLSRLAGEANTMNRVVLSNLWLFQSFVINKFQLSPATHAAVNTTMVATQLSASTKINVLPTTVTANLNIRILPGDSIESVRRYVKETIKNPQIKLRVVDGAFEPASVSVIDDEAYQQIEKSILQVYPDALVAPGLVLAATDSRHYQDLTTRIYRFMPLRLSKRDLSRIHGVNERILIQDYHAAIRFYRQLLMNLALNRATGTR